MSEEIRARLRASHTFEEPTRELRELAHETSFESFDRLAFAQRALELLGPRRTRCIIAPSRRMHVDSGRDWGRGEDARWAALYVPHDASRRAIAVAVIGLGGAPYTPYALDILMNADRL